MAIKAKIEVVYAAHGDGGERSDGPIIGVYARKSDAVAKAKGRGWYGDGAITERKAIIISPTEAYLLDSSYDEVLDLDGNRERIRKETKKRALAKLSSDEIDVLGIDRRESE